MAGLSFSDSQEESEHRNTQNEFEDAIQPLHSMFLICVKCSKWHNLERNE